MTRIPGNSGHVPNSPRDAVHVRAVRQRAGQQREKGAGRGGLRAGYGRAREDRAHRRELIGDRALFSLCNASTISLHWLRTSQLGKTDMTIDEIEEKVENNQYDYDFII